ncbi:MAG: hypothetical protein AABZ33_04900 [Chloroflexota bacterium]
MSFEADYLVEVLPGLPGSEEALAFARAGISTHSEGFIVRVRRGSSRSWIGNFQPGDGSLSTWAPTPASASLLVVAGGTGYLVSVDHPEEFQVLPSYPIRQIATIAQAGLLVVADHISIAATDGVRVLWVSERLAWDGLEIDEASPRIIRGHSVDPSTGRASLFVIETRSGLLVQGRAVPG